MDDELKHIIRFISRNANTLATDQENYNRTIDRLLDTDRRRSDFYSLFTNESTDAPPMLHRPNSIRHGPRSGGNHQCHRTSGDSSNPQGLRAYQGHAMVETGVTADLGPDRSSDDRTKQTTLRDNVEVVCTNADDKKRNANSDGKITHFLYAPEALREEILTRENPYYEYLGTAGRQEVLARNLQICREDPLCGQIISFRSKQSKKKRQPPGQAQYVVIDDEQSSNKSNKRPKIM